MRVSVLDIMVSVGLCCVFYGACLQLGLDSGVWIAFAPGSVLALRASWNSAIAVERKVLLLLAASGAAGAASAVILYVSAFAVADLVWTTTNGGLLALLSSIVMVVGFIEGVVLGIPFALVLISSAKPMP